MSQQRTYTAQACFGSDRQGRLQSSKGRRQKVTRSRSILVLDMAGAQSKARKMTPKQWAKCPLLFVNTKGVRWVLTVGGRRFVNGIHSAHNSHAANAQCARHRTSNSAAQRGTHLTNTSPNAGCTGVLRRPHGHATFRCSYLFRVMHHCCCNLRLTVDACCLNAEGSRPQPPKS